MMTLSAFFAPARVTILGLRQRWPMALATALGIALVVVTLLGFLAAADGFRRSLEAAGSPGVTIIVSRNARSEGNSVIDPATLAVLRAGLAAQGVADFAHSPERVRTAVALRAGTAPTSVLLRGVGPHALALRPSLTIVAGRAAKPGARELLVGRATARRLEVSDVGTVLTIEGEAWRVVGMFTAGGSAIESEIWADIDVMAAAAPGGTDGIQSLRLLAGDPLRNRLKKALIVDPRLSIAVEREDKFLAGQGAGVANMLRRFGWPIAIVMAVGALAGALNTMYSSVAVRSREIATLRAIGFGRAATFTATFTEALVLALIGALAGVGAGLAVFQGRAATTLGAGAVETSFTFALTPGAIMAAVGFALITGALGGALPALRAARQPILKGLAADV